VTKEMKAAYCSKSPSVFAIAIQSSERTVDVAQIAPSTWTLKSFQVLLQEILTLPVFSKRSISVALTNVTQWLTSTTSTFLAPMMM
jgi:hypothetical protein